MGRWAWSRLSFVAILFALAVAASLVSWQRQPPTAQVDGASINMRNVPGDLAAVLWLYVVEFVVAAAAFQPWLGRPRRSVLASVGALFGLWAILRWVAGLHSPPVMFAHDVLVLLVALALGGAALAYRPAERHSEIDATVT